MMKEYKSIGDRTLDHPMSDWMKNVCGEFRTKADDGTKVRGGDPQAH
jgi:hypothetical protein